MNKYKVFCKALVSLVPVIFFLTGCVYITHLDETMFIKGLADSQKQMQAEINRQEKLYNKLKTDINRGSLKTLTKKRAIINRYGKPVLCKPVAGEVVVKETCVYRKPTGQMLSEIILLNLDARARLCSWEIQNTEI